MFGKTTTSSDPIGDDPRRTATRHRTDLPCDLGDVVDLSSTGMRVTCKRKPSIKLGLVRKIKIRSAEGTLAVQGRSVWIKRRGFRSYEIGIQFVDLRPGLAKALDSLAQFGFLRANHESRASRSSKRSKPQVRATVDLPDYYKILGVEVQASTDEIRNAYRQLALRYHPDVTTDHDGQQKFIQAREAYEMLKDAKRRMNYDLQLAG